MKLSLIFCFAIFLIHCQQPVNKTDTLHKRIENRKRSEKKITQDSSATNCHDLLLQLIKSSNIDAETKKLHFDFRIDNVTDKVETIELTYRNGERNEDVSLGWMEIDFDRNELRDVTIDPEKPGQLKFDSVLFKKVIRFCKNKSAKK